MRINKIQNNQVFRGLFIDKTKNEEWHMEYRPYSWENPTIYKYSSEKIYDVKKTEMANKEPINMLAVKLPDNEEIFTPAKGDLPAISKDIFGTVSYYEYPIDVKLGEFRKTITPGEPMNLEESLKVAIQKHEKFREMKLEALKDTKEKTNESFKKLEKGISTCQNAAYKCDGVSLFKDSEQTARGKAFFDLNYDILPKHKKNVEEYIGITESIGALDKYIKQMRDEVELISEKKKQGNVIDISIRHQYDPNKALYDEAMKIIENPNPKEITKTEKLVLLSHRSIPLKEMIQSWIKGYNTTLENLIANNWLKKMPVELTHMADGMISFRR